MTFLITVENLPRQVDGLERARTIYPNEPHARFDLKLDTESRRSAWEQGRRNQEAGATEGSQRCDRLLRDSPCPLTELSTRCHRQIA